MSGMTATLTAGVVGASTLVLVGMALVATWLSGFHEERARRAEGAVRRGARLRRGFGAVRGTASRLDGRAGGALATTAVTQVRFGGGAWRDAGRTTTGEPFVVVLDGGEEVEVDPREAVVESERTEIHGHSFSRDVLHRVSTGDAIWVTGILAPRRAEGAGAYRQGSSRARITATRRSPVRIASTSPVPRWRALAAAHKVGAFFAIGAGALLHALLFRKIDLALLLRDSVACDTLLLDERALRLLVLGGIAAIFVAAFGWRQRLLRAHVAPLD